MVNDISSARQLIQERQAELDGARGTLQTETARSEEARQALLKAQNNQLSQKSLRQGGIQGMVARKRNLSTIQTQQEKLALRDDLLSSYSSELGTVEQQIQAANESINTAERAQIDFERALDVYNNEAPVFALDTPGAKDYYQQLQQGKQSAIEATISDLQKGANLDAQTLADIREYLTFNAGKVSNKRLNEGFTNLVNQGLTAESFYTIPGVELPPQELQVLGEVSAFEEPQGLTGVLYRIGRGKAESKAILKDPNTGTFRKIGENIDLFGAGIGSVVFGSLLGAKQLLTTNPKTTIKNLPSGIQEAGTQFGVDIIESPSFALGQVGANLLLSELPKTVPVIIRGAETATGLPRFNTVFFGDEILNVGGDIPTSTLATQSRTVRQGLLGNRDFSSGSLAKIQNMPGLTDDITKFKGGAITATREYLGVDIVTGKPIFRNPTPSGDLFFGSSKSTPLNVFDIDNSGGVRRYLPIDKDQSFIFRGSSQSYLPGSKPSPGAFSGLGIDIDSGTFSILRDRPVKVKNGVARLGRGQGGTSTGFVRKPKNQISVPTDDLLFSGGSVQKQVKQNNRNAAIAKAKLRKSIEKAIEKQVQEQRIQTAKAFGRSVPISSTGLNILQTPKEEQSIFYGQGTYERTSDVALTQPLGLSIVNIQGVVPKLDYSLGTASMERTQQTPKIRQTPRLNDRFLQVPKVNLSFRPRTEARTKITPRFNFNSSNRPPRRTPRPRTQPNDDEFRRRRPLRSNRQGRDSLFTAQVKRRGKYQNILTGDNFSNVFMGGTQRVKGTLAASLRVLKDGNPIKIPTPRGFGFSKRDPFAIVQSKRSNGGRLGSFGERREIKQARRAQLGLFSSRALRRKRK